MDDLAMGPCVESDHRFSGDAVVQVNPEPVQAAERRHRPELAVREEASDLVLGRQARLGEAEGRP